MNITITLPSSRVDAIANLMKNENLDELIIDTASAMQSEETSCLESSLIFLEALLVAYEEQTGNIHPVDSLYPTLCSFVDEKTL